MALWWRKNKEQRRRFEAAGGKNKRAIDLQRKWRCNGGKTKSCGADLKLLEEKQKGHRFTQTVVAIDGAVAAEKQRAALLNKNVMMKNKQKNFCKSCSCYRFIL